LGSKAGTDAHANSFVDCFVFRAGKQAEYRGGKGQWLSSRPKGCASLPLSSIAHRKHIQNAFPQTSYSNAPVLYQKPLQPIIITRIIVICETNVNECE
jgi:hypothetical protein